eukprot:CAMPEP_0204629124 /NCGR_PEP_ID=MMETSP0717-20131115/17446_1 /ASSEMBLY_ACC=CAM_ASM_000666 /TAXON_ID=230516 /ORGANISM="Chaetoceros curvisetus" /LENGTH=200 /DNA_ID=CAMNT_0051645969 /DNA_START=331 /DNA_END=929 /DNA_ORIENTATION=-
MTGTAKLHYYRAQGRGNQVRLALSAAGIPFEDVYPTCGFPPSEEQKNTWMKIGGNITTNIPMLEMDGKVYTQSMAVSFAVARKGGLMPSGDDALYITDKLASDAEDFRTASYKCVTTWGASQELADQFVADVIPKHFENFERQLNESGKAFFVTDELTIADILVYDAVVNFGTNREPNALDGFSALKEWKGRVESNQGIA